MIARVCVGAAAVLIVGITPARAFDFQLQSSTVEEDGFRHEQPFFRQGAKNNVLITLPQGWSRADGPGSLTLTSSQEPDTTIRLENSPFTPDTPFKDKGLDDYRQRVAATVPQGATGVQIEERDAPLPVFHWRSHEFILSYAFYGREFRRSVIFLDLDTREQIEVTTLARQVKFDAAREAALDVMRSWQVVPAG